jgi:hypothetical protein
MEQAILRHESSRKTKGIYLLLRIKKNTNLRTCLVGHPQGGQEETGGTHTG